MNLRRRVSARLAPYSSPLLTRTLSAIGVIGISIGIPGSWFSPPLTALIYVGMGGLIALMLVCSLIRIEDFERAQSQRAERRAERQEARTKPLAISELEAEA